MDTSTFDSVVPHPAFMILDNTGSRIGKDSSSALIHELKAMMKEIVDMDPIPSNSFEDVRNDGDEHGLRSGG